MGPPRTCCELRTTLGRKSMRLSPFLGYYLQRPSTVHQQQHIQLVPHHHYYYMHRDCCFIVIKWNNSCINSKLSAFQVYFCSETYPTGDPDVGKNKSHIVVTLLAQPMTTATKSSPTEEGKEEQRKLYSSAIGLTHSKDSRTCHSCRRRRGRRGRSTGSHRWSMIV
mmetsp:Transcript_12568/g.21360  ORF Transcript_12568/g.21360 Transcript_12568/m.21360 type:complete len:166 (+) Transcript_12568:988-1485(+)